MLHESEVAGTTYGIPHQGNIYTRITPTVDVSICNQNPHRKLPNSNALVSGYDNAGNFQGVIPEGSTHGYWTTSDIADTLIPEDHAGSSTERYVSRIIFVFDLNQAGISHDMVNVYGNQLTQNATWYEFDHSGTGVSGAGEGVGQRGFEGTTGPTHGVNRWDNQGMGFTGSTAEHRGDNFGGTGQWLDYSDGPAGSNQDTTYSTPLYAEFEASRATAIAGGVVKIDFYNAVEDARANYNNYLRFMIKIRDDQDSEGGPLRYQFISMHSSEADPDKNLTNAGEEPDYAPSIHITYSR